MNLLFISHERGVNGSTRSLIDMIKAVQNDNGLNICVLIPRKGNASSLLEKEKINYRTMYYQSDFIKIDHKNCFLWEMIKEIINILAVIRLCLFCKKQKIDVIHSNSTAVDIGARCALKLKLPHIFHVREFMEEDFKYAYRNKHRMKKLIEKSQYCLFISNAIRNKYVNLYAIKNPFTMYDKIDTKSYYQIRNDLLEDEKLSLIMTGGIIKGKGIHTAIRAVNEVIKSGLIKAEFLIIGNADKEYLAEIMAYIKQQRLTDIIHIKEFAADVALYRRKADICLVCSDCEGLGRTTIESMLAGLLVIGSNSGATPELITHDETGMLYETGNVESLASCIELVGTKRQKYKKIAKSGQEWALQIFGKSDYAEKLINIWRSCCEKRFK